MIERTESAYLLSWAERTDRKPLIIRGARQVGKTFLVRELGKRFPVFIEYNFDETPLKESLFAGELEKVISYIEADSGKRVIPGKTLLFLDEVQAAPAVLPQLRYFHEKLPGLHVIAAGSLLEFLLMDHEFSMPVGRVEYLFLGPISFKEYLGASEDPGLADVLDSFELQDRLPDALHERLLHHLQHYCVIGGMPEAAASWMEHRDILGIGRIQSGILRTYADDFGKYGKRIDPELLRQLLMRLPLSVGKKFKYVNVDVNQPPAKILNGLKALESAGIVSLIYHSDGNGVPLGAKISTKKFKPLFLDIGLYSSSLSLRLSDIGHIEDLMQVNRGALAEQFIGQHLMSLRNPWDKPELYYWQRDRKGASAELDYLFSIGPKVIPVEVKAGKTGTIRSLHTFMALKNASLGVRFYRGQPSIDPVSTTIQEIGAARYTMISLPLYMVGETVRIIDAFPASHLQ